MTTKINGKTTLYSGRIFHLVRENLTLQNGITVDLDVIRHPGAAAIVPFADSETLLMIRQYRHAAGGFIWEIPAGTLDPNESPLECAKRELIEETGFRSEHFTFLGEITPLPGYSDERIHIFMATGLVPARQHLDPDEILEVQRVPFADAIQKVKTSEIQDAKTISGLFLAKLNLEEA